MRVIDTNDLVPVIEELLIDACVNLNKELVEAFKLALEKEDHPLGREALSILIKNSAIAKEKEIPACQDTGVFVVFIEIGQDVFLTGDPLEAAVNEAAGNACKNGFLRASMVADPLRRANTLDNTPAVLHIKQSQSKKNAEKIKITVLPKGGGSENMSVYKNLLPGSGKEGIKKFVIQSVREAGGKPCPPITLGIGIGGTMDYCTLLSKESLLRPLNRRNKDPFYADFEVELIEEINKLGIGPLGMGGRTSVLDVHIKAYPCHIASLPVAISFQCHSARVKSRVL